MWVKNGRVKVAEDEFRLVKNGVEWFKMGGWAMVSSLQEEYVKVGQ